MDLLDGVDDSNASCPSVDELQIQLRAMFQTKVAETRAQHITSTFELQASALFHLVITETENDALDSLHFLENNTSLNNTGVDGLIHRSVSAMDALIHQSQDDPVLQKIIAKHIVNSINTVDGSSWTVRQVSRESQGWVFTYICKDSLQAWNRQYAKNPGRPPICECTSKEDNINQSRPAFDCRGAITISFYRSSRIITVIYEHTPLHRTVAELMAFHAPPPPPPARITAKKRARASTTATSAANVATTVAATTVPSTATVATALLETPPEAPAASDFAFNNSNNSNNGSNNGSHNGSNNGSNNNSNSNNSNNNDNITNATTIATTIATTTNNTTNTTNTTDTTDTTDTTNTNNTTTNNTITNNTITITNTNNNTNNTDTKNGPPRKKRRKKDKTPEEPAIPPPEYQSAEDTTTQQAPSYHIEQPSAQQSIYPEPVQEESGPAAVNSGFVNVAPEEANRRKEVAIKLLSSSGIDPETLSTDQFNIFANQSPDLQKESLALLVKYGAERLRIVHPTKDTIQPHQEPNSASESSQPLSHQNKTHSPKKSRKKKRSSAAADIRNTEAAATPIAPPQMTGQAPDAVQEPIPAPSYTGNVTRGACNNCKRHKMKCDHIKPYCRNCLNEGVSCEYAMAKSRKPRKKLTNKVVQEEDPPISTDGTELPMAPAPEAAEMPYPEPEPVAGPESESATPETLGVAALTALVRHGHPSSGTLGSSNIEMGNTSAVSGSIFENDIYQPNNTTVPFPSQVASQPAQSIQSSGLDYNQPDDMAQRQSRQATHQTTLHETSPSVASQSKSRQNRHNLPSGPSSTPVLASPIPSLQQEQHEIQNQQQHQNVNPAWHHISNAEVNTTQAVNSSSTLAQQQSSVGLKSQRTVQQVLFDSNPTYDNVQQATAFPQTAVSSASHSTFTPEAQELAQSPQQAISAAASQGRSKSRQGYHARIPTSIQSTIDHEQSHPVSPSYPTTVPETSSGSSYDTCGRYPLSTHTGDATLSSHSYDSYSRSSTDTGITSSHTAAPSSQPINLKSCTATSSESSQWPSYHARNSTNSYPSNAANASESSYSAVAASQAHEAAATLSQFNIRPSAIHHEYSPPATNNQKQTQHSHIQQQQQQSSYNKTHSVQVQVRSQSVGQQDGFENESTSTNNITSFGNTDIRRSSASSYTNNSANNTYNSGYQSRQMELAGNGYGATDGDAAIYDLLRNSNAQ